MSVDVTEARIPLAQRAYELLRTSIVNAELQPGSELTAKALSSELGIGLTPVREALGRLDSEGLVLTEPRHCYLVTPLTPDSVRELIELYEQGLILVYSLLFERADDVDLANVVRGYESIAQTTDISKEAMRDRSRTNSEWLVQCCRVARNERLGQLMAQLSDEMQRLRALITKDLPPEAVPIMYAVSEALATRNLEAARTAVRGYLTMMQSCMLDLLERHPALSGSLDDQPSHTVPSAGHNRSVATSRT